MTCEHGERDAHFYDDPIEQEQSAWCVGPVVNEALRRTASTNRPNPLDCEHVFGPYFTRVPFKVYWLKCYRCLLRYGPYLSVERTMDKLREETI